MRPTKYLRKWSAVDRTLAEALLLHEKAFDPHGIPWEIALDPEKGSWLDVDERINWAAAAVENWRAQGSHEPGAYPVVIDTRQADPTE